MNNSTNFYHVKIYLDFNHAFILMIGKSSKDFDLYEGVKFYLKNLGCTSKYVVNGTGFAKATVYENYLVIMVKAKEVQERVINLNFKYF